MTDVKSNRGKNPGSVRPKRKVRPDGDRYLSGRRFSAFPESAKKEPVIDGCPVALYKQSNI
ncbi:MAG: hypothetical protein HGA31_03080 [Candidatus Moranbacteria bacterium]|nr:hypothetical protein [Candidatus Moranbacteria bacterium]